MWYTENLQGGFEVKILLIILAYLFVIFIGNSIKPVENDIDIEEFYGHLR